jgi:hypothetical protein
VAFSLSLAMPVLLDYQDANRLDDSQNQSLLKLCRNVFRADYLLNQVLFLDGNRSILPMKDGTISNVFYQVQAQKLTVYTPEWLDFFYERPMARLLLLAEQQQQQVNMTIGSFFCTETRAARWRHCDHCGGFSTRYTCHHACPVSASCLCSKAEDEMVRFPSSSGKECLGSRIGSLVERQG